MEQLPLYIEIFIFIIIILWVVPLKVYAIWMAVKHNHKKWFVALVILNTFSFLEIFYIFRVARKSWIEVKTDFKEVLFSSIK